MWRALLIDSLKRPRVAARRVLDAHVPPQQLVEAAILVSVLGVVLGYLALVMSPEAIDVISAAVIHNPLLGAATQLAVMAVAVVLTVRIGRLFGGTGTIEGALALVVWLNAVLVLVQAVQLVALAVVPPLATILAVATIVWALWAFANFVAELHGFQNPFIVLAVVILTSIVLFFGTAMVFAILGITPQGAS